MQGQILIERQGDGETRDQLVGVGDHRFAEIGIVHA
jgi:hypothetical protein